MFRKISNRLHKRSKTLEEKLELDETIRIIRNIDTNRLKKIKCTISFFIIATYMLKKATPYKVAYFLEKSLVKGNLAPKEKDDYINIKYEVFSNKYGKEKHYIDVVRGNRNDLFADFIENIKYLLNPSN